MRIAFSLSASPAGTLAAAQAGTPFSLAVFSMTPRAAGHAGTQIAPVPKSCVTASGAFFSQYTSQLAFNKRLIVMKELFTRWLSRNPAVPDPVIEVAGGASSRSFTLVNG